MRGTLSARIKTAFAADTLVKARDIKVDVMRGVVTLNGTVNSTAERDKAISIARNTHVRNTSPKPKLTRYAVGSRGRTPCLT